MRKLSDIEIEKIGLLTAKSVSLCLIEPTTSGLGKSIMDATGTVRNYLKSNQIHDFDLQLQGPDNKIQVSSFLVFEDKIFNSISSLYRPNTKKGDPRIWFKGLGSYAKPNDILGIIAFQNQLFVVNITQLDFKKLLKSALINPLKDLINEINRITNTISDELLFKLREIAKRGFTKSLVNSDTGVGRTLEKLLGIDMNSSKAPDYKGIELKSFREKRTNRKGLFGKTPDWELSKFKSRIEILDNFGYWKDGIFRLYNTIRGTGRNAQGLILRVEYETNRLYENSDRPDIGDFLTWEMQVLKKALAEKHKETFWIAAESEIRNGDEYFLYKKAEHTKNPMVDQLGLLIEIGAITLDYPIKRLTDGSTIDKGCNFKLNPKSSNLLFPPSQIYSLINL